MLLFIHMLCPNCGQQMNVRNVDNEIVLHCATCGSSFFDKGGINKISQGSARTLTEEAQGQYVLGNQKVCPKDKSILLEKVDPNLPKNTILLECPSCEGIFAYPDDLLKYKGVKEATPLTSGAFKLLPPKSLFMLASFAVLTVAVLMNAGNFSTNTRASSVVGKVIITASTANPTVYFLSDLSQDVRIVFYDKDRKQTREYTIHPGSEKTASGKTYYQAPIRGFEKNIDFFYRIIFTPADESAPMNEVQL